LVENSALFEQLQTNEEQSGMNKTDWMIEILSNYIVYAVDISNSASVSLFLPYLTVSLLNFWCLLWQRGSCTIARIVI